jgi:hypothetical protein
MIKLKFNGKIYPIKNKLTEFTIGEFEKICELMNSSGSTIERWFNVFELLGIEEDILNNIDIEDFIKIIKDFNLNAKIFKGNVKKEIILNNIKYYAYEDKFRLTVKETALIESYIQKNDNRYLGELVAIVYKNPELQKELHFEKAHIHFKAELIRKNITADIAIPLINFLSKRLIKDVELIQKVNE